MVTTEKWLVQGVARAGAVGPSLCVGLLCLLYEQFYAFGASKKTASCPNSPDRLGSANHPACRLCGLYRQSAADLFYQLFHGGRFIGLYSLAVLLLFGSQRLPAGLLCRHDFSCGIGGVNACRLAFGQPSADDCVRCLAVQDQHGHATGFSYIDRKSTRLNSSHVRISYAVFCLK